MELPDIEPKIAAPSWLANPRQPDSSYIDAEVSTPYEAGFDDGVDDTLWHRFKPQWGVGARLEYSNGYREGEERTMNMRDFGDPDWWEDNA